MPRFVCGLAAVLLLAACDTVAPEPITLAEKSVTFRFEFRSEDLSGSEPVVASTGGVDLAGRLDGFSPDEILSARVVGVELERVQPSAANLDALLRGVTVRIGAEGLSERDVASSASLPASRFADLTVLGGDVGSLIRRAPFTSSLVLRPNSLPADRYVFEVHVRLSIDVEGL